MTGRPLILLSNDDGVHAKGMRTLHTALTRFADVVVVAPLVEQSAKSHALTLASPLVVVPLLFRRRVRDEELEHVISLVLRATSR